MKIISFPSFEEGGSSVSPDHCGCDFSTKEHAEASNGMRRKHTHDGKCGGEFVFDAVTHTCQDKRVHKKWEWGQTSKKENRLLILSRQQFESFL